MGATTTQDGAASPLTFVENGPEADGFSAPRHSVSLLEALDAIQPKAAAGGPEQCQGADGACDASISRGNEQNVGIANALKWPSLDKLEGRARAVAERVASVCETGQEFDVFLATLEKKAMSAPGDFSRHDCRRWLKRVFEEGGEDISDEGIDGQAGPEGHPDTGEVAEANWSLKTVFVMHGRHVATDIAAQESDVAQFLDVSFGERHFKEEPDEKRLECECDHEDQFASDAWTWTSAEVYYRRTVLVMVPSWEAFKFLSSCSGITHEGVRCQFEQFKQHDHRLLRILNSVEPGLSIRIRKRYEVMNKLFPPTVPMSNELKSIVSSMVDSSLDILRHRGSGLSRSGHLFMGNELRAEDATALFEMPLSYMGFGITPPSKKRKAAALALGDTTATVTQYNMPPSAGAKRRATEFMHLTSDGD